MVPPRLHALPLAQDHTMGPSSPLPSATAGTVLSWSCGQRTTRVSSVLQGWPLNSNPMGLSLGARRRREG